MRRRHDELLISRKPKNDYGSLEPAIRGIRDHRALDLNAEVWRENHPNGSFDEWRDEARTSLLEGFHYDPCPLDLRPEVLSREERPEMIIEKVAFNTTPWFRVSGYFLTPKQGPVPFPTLVVLHGWGGPLLVGKERIVETGRDHPVLVEHRKKHYGGTYLTEAFVKAGYAVIVIDAYHFGERAPRGLPGVDSEYDPFSLDPQEFQRLDDAVGRHIYLGVRQLNWAGTTWMGVNFWDDCRTVDYLLTRPEVDPARIGCTGLSGGGWRTNMLAALDDRIRASVSVGWMTTGDYQQVYNVAGAVGTFCLLPGVWNRLDVCDLTIMSAPTAAMVINCAEDHLFPPEGQHDAARQIQEGYAWAGCPERFRHNNPVKPHTYDPALQADAVTWFDQHLK